MRFLALCVLVFYAVSVEAAVTVRNENLITRDEISRVIPPLTGRVPSSQSHALIKLGNRLFTDTRLSGSQDVACSSCHRLEQGGSDGRRYARPQYHVNTPSIFNLRFYDRYYWNGRVSTLEAQADNAISNPVEMASDWSRVVNLVRTDPIYNALFAAAFQDGSIGKEQVIRALVAYERSLVVVDSRFDRYLSGDLQALSDDEVKGARLFMDYGCVACHQGVNIGTNLYQKLGVVVPYVDSDGGRDGFDRFVVTGREEDIQRVRVPSLRNIALTAPYLHDGSVAKLTDVVTIMFRHQLGWEPAPTDLSLIVKFLMTLTGKTGL